MAKPTLQDHQTRVIKAFNKIGFGGKFSTYSVVEKDHDKVCINKVGGKMMHYLRVMDETELSERACDLTQSRYNDISKTYTHLQDSEMFIVYRLVQNMLVKLHGTNTPQYMYYDAKKDSVIARCGKVILEIELILNHRVDISTNAMYDYLAAVGDFVEGAAESKEAKMFTMYGELRFTLDNGTKVYPQITVTDFKKFWEA